MIDGERPCQRCSKRGLAGACQDGVRKKAKYLQEDDRPVLANHSQANNSNFSNNSNSGHSSTSTSPRISGFIEADNSPSYAILSAPPAQARLIQAPSIPEVSKQIQTTFDRPLFDPSNPALFNFDLEGLNFGNHYGALEFGMLEHISSRAADTSLSGNNGVCSDDASLLATMVSNSLQTTNNYSSRTQHPVYQDENTLPSVSGEYTRDPSSIYHIVNEPYSYTTGFHKLNAYFLRRFSANKSLRIAKFLASVRPSFLSCAKNLSRQDLIFTERYFQRILVEYEAFMRNCCSPTLLCRRTGEVAGVSEEFTLLTGWKKDVLLGKEATLNIYAGGSDSAPTSPRNPGQGRQKKGLLELQGRRRDLTLCFWRSCWTMTV